MAGASVGIVREVQKLIKMEELLGQRIIGQDLALKAVANAIRHGRPTRIDIKVSYDERQVALTIADDGCGFNAEAQTSASRDSEHFGLVTMRERAEHVGGGLRIESAPGSGTTVHAVAGMTNEWA